MGFFSRLFSRRKPQRAKSIYSPGGSSEWITARGGGNYTSYASEGYKSNIIVYRCISLIARGVASLRWIGYSGSDELDPSHPFVRIFYRPNPQQSGFTLFETLVSHLLLSGNAYLRAIGPEIGPPLELYALRPDKVDVLLDDNGNIIGYKYKTTQSQYTVFNADFSNWPDSIDTEVLHIKLFDPLNTIYGMSPLQAAAYSIDQYNAGSEWNYNLIKNGAKPTGVLTYEPGGDTIPSLSDEQFERLKSEINETYFGAKNAGRPMILDGGLKWQQLSFSPSELDWTASRNMLAREIAQIFGVPPVLVGLDDPTYANQAEARLSLWEDTILPLAGKLRDELNWWLSPQFGEDMRIEYDSDDIPALVQKRQDLWEKLQGVDFLTINEKREAVGYEPIDGGDTLPQPKKEKENAVSK